MCALQFAPKQEARVEEHGALFEVTLPTDQGWCMCMPSMIMWSMQTSGVQSESGHELETECLLPCTLLMA